MNTENKNEDLDTDDTIYEYEEDRRSIPLIQPTILFDEETCNKIDWEKFYPF
jgi:hypothetical protein